MPLASKSKQLFGRDRPDAVIYCLIIYEKKVTTMKSKIRNFLFNGLCYGIIFFALGFILGYFVIDFSLRTAILNALPMGLLAFVVNGLIQSRFLKSSSTLRSITIDMPGDELLKLAAPANHTIADSLVSGKLFLTGDRLIFRSCEKQEYAWLLTSLHSFKFHPSLFNAGGTFIASADLQNQLVFEVDELKTWKKALEHK